MQRKKLHLSILHTAIPDIHGKWTATATRKWMLSIRFPGRHAAISWSFTRYEEKSAGFHNIIERRRIEGLKKPGGFSDSYDGVRILTVGRLAHQKAYDIAILAMKQIRDAGYKARWYVVGEGPERKALEKQIAELRLQKDFILLGIKENPFPYYAQCDLYVHATRFEGKSIAIQEAQALGCAVIASDCAGNREQIEDESMVCSAC